jgi:hypothetical protein
MLRSLCIKLYASLNTFLAHLEKFLDSQRTARICPYVFNLSGTGATRAFGKADSKKYVWPHKSCLSAFAFHVSQIHSRFCGGGNTNLLFCTPTP